jgi:hypothetical protein
MWQKLKENITTKIYFLIWTVGVGVCQKSEYFSTTPRKRAYTHTCEYYVNHTVLEGRD